MPDELELHLILDNYGTHKTPAIKRWLVRHPRFHLHFTPTSGSWLNLVERWFAALTEKQLRRGAHRRPANSRTPSAATWSSATVIPNPSSGPRPPTKSSNRSLDFVNVLQTQDTSKEHTVVETGVLAPAGLQAIRTHSKKLLRTLASFVLQTQTFDTRGNVQAILAFY